MKTSFLFLAEGFEEMEAMAPIDILRRAGMPVVTVSISNSLQVKGAHGITVTADALFAETDFKDADWLILPGGMPGASNLAAHAGLCDMLKRHNAENRHVAAICASPAVVLAPLGILDGKEAICYPGFEDALYCAKLSAKPVEADANVITANGPSSATLFALAIVAGTLGEQKSTEIAEGLLLYDRPQEFYF